MKIRFKMSSDLYLLMKTRGIMRRDWEKDWEIPESAGFRHGMRRSKISLSAQKTRPVHRSSSQREEPTPQFPKPRSRFPDREPSTSVAQGRNVALEEYNRRQQQAKQPSGFDKAVDGLRKAERAATFEKAILASAAAATSAPSEQQEELAAAAGAKFLQAANVTSMEKMKRTLVDGDKLIEVVGYIGITKPKEKKQG
ncbi:hypothetical protein J437_LFUL011822 [Ladona fulva]|uniref:Uncharacterized protein n=1 Tax=Ladona fulva TaxID=123851 RepID=A0A8K0P3N2_LADFU|nr:hypothetical protein J437_LFUL011822 [Ladona fulva]